MFDADATLAFDWNTGAIGVLGVYSDQYRCFPYSELETGAEFVLSHPGVLVSFNGSVRDLKELRRIVKDERRDFSGPHFDMLDETSKIRWPPKLDTSPIHGTGLADTYKFFDGPEHPPEPIEFESPYFRKVWFDCYRTAYLYRAWVQNRLTSRGLDA